MEMRLTSDNSLYNIIPIRGGEKVNIELETARGTWEFEDLYVYKVSALDSQGVQESFTLNLVSREFLTNETIDVYGSMKRKYS